MPATALWRRSSSRASRLARLRVTAEPSFRVAATPVLACEPDVRMTNSVISAPLRLDPVVYTRSKSDRFLRRCARGRRLSSRQSGRRSASALVGDRQPFAARRTAPLQDQSSVLGRHSDAKAVRLLAAAGVRLVGPLALHGVVGTSDRLVNGSPRTVGQTSMVVALSTCVNRRATVLQSPILGGLRPRYANVHHDSACFQSQLFNASRGLGFSPSFPQRVENAVEIKVFS